MVRKALLWSATALGIFAVVAIHDRPDLAALAAIGAFSLYIVSEVSA